MSKQKKTANKKIPLVTTSVDKKSSKQPTAQKNSRAMVNWFMVFLAIFPFVFSRNNMDPVLALRYTCIAAFVLLFVLYFFAIRKRSNTNWPPLVKLVFLLGIGYGIWNFISLTEAVNKQQVYYGLARHFMNLILLFMVTCTAEKEENYLINICKVLSLVALAHFIIAVCQFYDAAFTNIPGNYVPYSIMANRNLFGSAQVMLLPFAMYLLYKGSMPWKAVAGISLMGITGSAILSQTRSSWMAALVMIILALIFIIIYSPANRKKWVVGTLTGLVITVLLGLLFMSTDLEGDFSQSLKDRTSNMFVGDTTGNTSSAAGNVSERLKIWKKTMELIKDNPVLGVGLGNWKITVAKYGSEGLAWAKGKYIPDSTHNDYLEVTSESGIPGAVMYFGMWLMIVIIGLKTIFKTQNSDRKIFSLLLVAALAGYAVESMFSFPMERMEHGFYLYLMGGILIGLYLNESNTEAKRKPIPIAIVLTMMIIAGFNFFLGLKKMSFEKYVIRAKSLEEQKNYQQSVIEGNKGKNSFVTIPPNGFPIEAYVGLSQKGLKNTTEALKEMDVALKYHPYNKALYVNKGTVYTDMGQYDSAIKYYNLALKLTPEMDIIFLNLAANYYQEKKYDKSLEMLKRADLTEYPTMATMKQQLEKMLDTTKKN